MDSLRIQKTPLAISNAIDITEANSILTIYEGLYYLKSDSEEIEIRGKITFEWFANSGVYFYGNPTNYSFDLLKVFSYPSSFDILIEGLILGKGFITSHTSGSNSEIHIKGIVNSEVTWGDKSIAVEKLRFSIPNLRDFHGMPIKKGNEEKYSISASRLIFEDLTYSITIDKCFDFRDRKDKIRTNGGYIILYYGELETKKGYIKYNDIKDIILCFNEFLTFLNGRRTSAMFIQGIFEEETKWIDYSDYKVDPHKAALSWTDNFCIEHLNDLWKKFRESWLKPENKNVLSSLIHWYVEANSQAGFIEGAIIFAQTALELIYNWWIVEDKKMILGKDSNSISASNKIRLIISQLNIPSEIPFSFKELTDYKAAIDKDKSMDAPEIIVQIRNAIVHSQEEKRRTLISIGRKAKYETLQIYIWYIELSLLCILNYEGKYINRCNSLSDTGNVGEVVPWKK